LWKGMEPESLPWIAGMVAAYIALKAVHGQRPPYETGYSLEILTGAVVLLSVSGIGHAFYLDMTEFLISIVAGACGGAVLGLGMALYGYTQGDSRGDLARTLLLSTASCAFIGLIAGSLFLT
jgi:hypothetical protein